MHHDLNGNLDLLEKYDETSALLSRNVLGYMSNRLTQETITPTPPADGAQGSNAPYRYDLSGYITRHDYESFDYDAERNLSHYLRNGASSRYVYDGGHRRVLKINATGTTRYVYDNQDHLIYELAPDNSKRNYAWLGDIPIAIIDQKADNTLDAIYFIETDYSNTPRILRRASGDLSKVWSWPIVPYGNTLAVQDPDGDGVKMIFNLRYPGQYYDSESGLHYNHTRYFSPRTGRYFQPDLIKLEGGINVYTYANGNPVSFVDPTGTAAEDSLTDQIGSFLDGFLSSFESGIIADSIRNQHFDDITPGALNDFDFAAATGPLGGWEWGVGKYFTRFSNLAPLDEIGNALTFSTNQIVKASYSGNLNYIVTEAGELIIGRSGHISLSSGADVLAAGQAKFVNGALRWLDNASGHYRPSGLSAQEAAEAAFLRSGFDATGKYLERKF